MDPKKSLAVDAPPVAPYDDGFSTESEDFNDPEDLSLPSREKAVKQAATDVKKPRNGQAPAHNNVKTEDKSEEYCRSCLGYLPPLAERIEAMQAAALGHNGAGPPPSKQCTCCQITYPLVALTDESSLAEPRCYMCNWAARAEQKARSLEVVGAGRMKSDDVVRVRGSGAVGTSSKPTTEVEEKLKVKEVNGNCMACKCELLPEDGRQRAVDSGAIGCNACGRSAVVAAQRSCNSADEKTGVVVQEPKKAPEIIVVVDSDEDEKKLEEDVCKCCLARLPSTLERRRMMTEAAAQHGGKLPPPSRQCACCRITYPSAALTAKSRKATRVVAICLKCCRSGGSAIYELLAASDQFIEAFKVENPEMARMLLKKKQNGQLGEAAANQRERNAKQKKCKGSLPVRPPVSYPPVARAPLPRSSTYATFTGMPRTFIRPYAPYLKMVRKNMSAPRQLLASAFYANVTPVQARLHTESKNGAQQEQATQRTSEQQPARPRTSRWLQQFEIIDGKTARERRLEKRNAIRELREAKKQRLR